MADWKQVLAAGAPWVAKAIGGPAPLALAAITTVGRTLLGKEKATEQEVADAVMSLAPSELALKLKEANNFFLIEMEKLAARRDEIDAAGVSDRWQADMGSDSWLSKNIRPMVLIYLLTAYTILAVASGAGFNVGQTYIELLGQWGIIVMTAYFGGRSVEKVFAIKGRA